MPIYDRTTRIRYISLKQQQKTSVLLHPLEASSFSADELQIVRGEADDTFVVRPHKSGFERL